MLSYGNIKNPQRVISVVFSGPRLFGFPEQLVLHAANIGNGKINKFSFPAGAASLIIVTGDAPENATARWKPLQGYKKRSEGPGRGRL